MNPTSKYQHNLALVLFFFLFIGLYYPLLSAKGLAPKDDWVSMLLTSDTAVHPQIQIWSKPWSSVERLLKWDIESVGRFRPAYWLFNVFETHLLISHARWWQFETLVIGVLTVWLFYYACRSLTFGFLPALWGGLWLTLSGSTLWTQKQTAEEPGLLILLIALNLIIYAGRSQSPSRWDWAAVTLLGLAGLIKESFILVIPAAIGLRLVLSWYEANFPGAGEETNRSIGQVLHTFRWLIAIGIAMTVGMMIFVFYAYQHDGYGYKITGEINSNRVVSISVLWAAVQSLQNRMLGFGPLLTLVVGIRYVRTLKHWMFCALGVALVLLWMWPQAVLYSKSGFGGYYNYPAALALVFLSSLGLEWVRRFMPTPVFLAIWGLCFVPLVYYDFTDSWLETRDFAAHINAFQGVVEATAMHADNDGSILVLSDVNRERDFTFLVELGRAHIQSPVYVVYDELWKAKHDGVIFKANDGLYKPFTPADADQIILIVSYLPVDEFWAYAAENFPWFDADEWNEQVIRADYEIISWRNLLGLGDFDTSRSIEHALFYR